MIQAGLVGTGPTWKRYRSVLPRLRRTLHVSAVFDGTPALAVEESAAPASGLRALGRRADVQAILLMNSGWIRCTAIELLASANKPILVADWSDMDRPRLEQLHQTASDCGVTIMPTMWRRYMPASIRLQELIATDLGPPHSIELTIDHPDTSSGCHSLEPLIGWIDYCRNLFRSFPASATLVSATDGSDLTTLQILYPAHVATDSSASPRQATIHLSRPGASSAMTEAATGTGASLPRISISCSGGSAAISSRSELQWNTNDEPPHVESLESERSEEEIMLDLFCRRVVGGLIPVADCNDQVQAMRVVEAAGIAMS